MRFGCLLVVGLGVVWGVLVVLPGFCWLNCVVVGYVTFCVCGFTICVVLLLRWFVDFVFELFSVFVGYGL